MEPRDGGEVSGHPSGHLSSRQTRDAISSLNEAWLHTLDEYVIDTLLSEVILRVMRACLFGGAAYAVLLAQRGSWQSGRFRYRWLPHRTAAVVIPMLHTALAWLCPRKMIRPDLAKPLARAHTTPVSVTAA